MSRVRCSTVRDSTVSDCAPQCWIIMTRRAIVSHSVLPRVPWLQACAGGLHQALVTWMRDGLLRCTDNVMHPPLTHGLRQSNHPETLFSVDCMARLEIWRRKRDPKGNTAQSDMTQYAGLSSSRGLDARFPKSKLSVYCFRTSGGISVIALREAERCPPHCLPETMRCNTPRLRSPALDFQSVSAESCAVANFFLLC